MSNTKNHARPKTIVTWLLGIEKNSKSLSGSDESIVTRACSSAPSDEIDWGPSDLATSSAHCCIQKKRRRPSGMRRMGNNPTLEKSANMWVSKCAGRSGRPRLQEMLERRRATRHLAHSITGAGEARVGWQWRPTGSPSSPRTGSARPVFRGGGYSAVHAVTGDGESKADDRRLPDQTASTVEQR